MSTAGLSVSSRAALAGIIQAAPDEVLSRLLVAVAQMAGPKARELETLLEAAVADRRRRLEAFGALIPLFRPRVDELEALTFPPPVLPRLWRAAGMRDVAALPLLDHLDDQGASLRAMARARLYAAAAAVLRQAPETVWPDAAEAAGLDASREARIAELAACCDIGVLAHRAVANLSDWVGRPDQDRLAELKIMVRDAAEGDADGVRRLMDILVAHLDEAAQILALTGNVVGAGGRGAMLRHSELSGVVERVLAALEVRAARIAAFAAGGDVPALRRDLAWTLSVLNAVYFTVGADAQGDWARRVAAAKTRVAAMIEAALGAAPKVMGRILPMHDVQTAGRMTRRMPRLDQAIAPEALEAAQAAADLIAAVRASAGVFGCESKRKHVLATIGAELTEYSDLALELLNAGGEADPAAAAARVLDLADVLERIEAETEARTVRRRVAALGGASGRPSAT